MTRDDIIRMAREAWLSDYGVTLFSSGEDVELALGDLERFAALVVSCEREACAELCVKLAVGGGFAADCAAAIRARGETK